MLKWKSVNTTNCSYICYNSYIASRGHWATSFIWSAIAITESRFIYKIARQHCRIHVDPVLKDSFFKDMPFYSIVKKNRPPHPCCSNYPRESYLEQIWIYNTRSCFHTSFRFCGQLVCKKKMYEIYYM